MTQTMVMSDYARDVQIKRTAAEAQASPIREHSRDLRVTRDLKALRGLRVTRDLKALRDIRVTRDLKAPRDLRVKKVTHSPIPTLRLSSWPL